MNDLPHGMACRTNILNGPLRPCEERAGVPYGISLQNWVSQKKEKSCGAALKKVQTKMIRDWTRTIANMDFEWAKT